MISPANLAAGCILASLVLYALTGGADFGGGVWALFNRGPRARERERVIVRAIGPVWETNHIWIIIAVVVLFTGFPAAYAVVSTALFLPVTLVLAGIVVRGSAFAFHSYHLHRESRAAGWGSLFSAASLLTPFLLGVILGAVSAGTIRGTGLADLASGTRSWLAPFPIFVGFLTLSACSYLAAVYLILETDTTAIREDFRRRGFLSLALLALLSVAVPLLASGGAQEFHRSLTESRWSFPLMGANALSAVGAGFFLLRRSYRTARICAAAQVTLLLVGWGLAQYPYLVRPDLTIISAAASPEMLRLVLFALAAGSLLLFPAIVLLLRVFKRESLFGR
jgi:cytochrome bd ubiquinol oxidase subunit II